MRIISYFMAGLIGIGCTGLDGSYKYSSGRSGKKTQPLPSTAISDNTLPNVTIQGKLCGIDGTFAVCDDTDFADFPGQGSSASIIEISNCKAFEVKRVYYAEDGCKSANELYSRKIDFTLTFQGIDNITQARLTDAQATLVTESFTPKGFLLPHWDSYVLCKRWHDNFRPGSVVVSTPANCTDDVGEDPIVDKRRMKQTSEGFYYGEGCEDGILDFCLESRSPTLETDGFPNWN